MPNVNGSVYGLTILSPIVDDEKATPSHDLKIRAYLATLPTGEESPFAQAAVSARATAAASTSASKTVTRSRPSTR